MTTPGNYLDCEQGSDLWAKLRCGYVTASRAADAIAMIESGKNKGNEKAERKNYRVELICERLTGVPYPQHVTREMQWGLDHENDAAAAYELETGQLVDRCGFVVHPSVSMFGASPDRLVGDDGLLQIKCPTTRTHMEWMLAGTIPLEHVTQMLAEMSCTGRDWCDFVSFDPRLPEHLQLFIRRYERDDRLIRSLESEIEHFNRELDGVLKLLPPGPQPAAKLLEMPRDDEPEGF